MTSVTRWGPSASQCSTSGTERVRLHLNAFRGEPAISRFDWHFTATHSSSEPSSTDTGSVLQPETIRPSTWPWVDHLVSGPLLLTRGLPPHALFGLGFPAAPALHQHVNLPANVTRRFILQKARRRTRTSLSCFDCLGTTGFRFCFTPLPRCFSPFPHGTGALSVARSS